MDQEIPERTVTRGALLTGSFAALLAGQIVAVLGDRLNSIVLIDLVSSETGKFARTGSAFELSKLVLAMTLPSLVLGPFVGAYVDRIRKKRVLVISNIVRGCAVLAIPLARPAFPMWTVYGIVALVYLANLFFLPARCAIVPQIVSRGALIRANALLSMGATLATVVGFGLGGLLVTHTGWRIALVIDAASYFISAGALAIMVPRTEPARLAAARRVSYLEAIREALGEMRRFVGTRAGVLVPPLLVAAGTAVSVLGVALVQSRVRQGTMATGLLLSLAGLGMAAGCYFTGRFLGRVDRERVAGIAAIGSIASLSLVGLTDRPFVLALAVIAGGFAAGPVFVASETAIQEQAKPGRQATVFAVRDALMKLGSILAGVGAPAIATLVGFRPAIVLLMIALLPLAAAAAHRKQ